MKKRISDQSGFKGAIINLEGNKSTNIHPLKANNSLTPNFNIEQMKHDKRFENKKHFIAALDILEKAQENKNKIQKPKEESSGFFSFLNPFRCGKCD